MEQTTTYRYEAKNDGSYNELAAYAIGLVANVSLFPAHRTIVIDDLSADVSKFIHLNNLDVFVEPIELNKETVGSLITAETVDPETLRRIINSQILEMQDMMAQHNDILAETMKERDRAREAGEMHYKWHKEAAEKVDRVKGQIKAIETLLHAIFPEE